jgi:serine/threonine-protein kinase
MAPAQGKPAADPLELRGTELLGRYLVEGAIAQGGMSVVYRGMDERLHRPVCVKIFHRIDPGDMAYQTSYEHFVQEAFALSQLAHPHTIRIYDFGYLDRDPRSPFQVSELMTGGTLSQRVRREGPLTPPTALALFEPLVGALGEAHARGIVHRDIKPSNILFTAVGNTQVAKLADFGIAKAGFDEDQRAFPNQAQDTSVAAGQRMSLYSPGWAAPEQLRAQPIGPPADVFALGLLLFYVLTGRPIYAPQGDISTFEDRILGDTHIERVVLESGLPPPIAEVILRACRERPDARFPSAEAFLAALDAATSALDDPPTGARPARAGPAPDAGADREHVATAAVPRPAPKRLVLDEHAADPAVVGGRRLRLVLIADQLDAGGADGPLRSHARFRLTLLPNAAGGPRLHVKGLNCFIARPGARPSSAAAVDGDTELELLAPDRRRLDLLRCSFGRAHDGAAQVFALGDVELAVPARFAQAVVLDLGPGRELALVHRAVPAAPTGRKARPTP